MCPTMQGLCLHLHASMCLCISSLDSKQAACVSMCYTAVCALKHMHKQGESMLKQGASGKDK